ncbi:MAG: GatB/YqeY domain-containing protein, partial [Alphaproteobacteria bacterium]
MRDRLKDVLTVSLKAGEKRRVATVRLILAAIKDRDIAVRSDGQADGVSDEEILAILQKMVKQRRESTVVYQVGGRLEVAAQEEEEITIIEEFLPQKLGQEELAVAVGEVVAESGATSLKDMGGVMGLLKERYGARMDFA